LVEKTCGVPSNLTGIVPDRFAKGRITSAFSKLRGVLKREGLIPQ